MKWDNFLGDGGHVEADPELSGLRSNISKLPSIL
jgi:hypothetical protein